MTDTVLELVNRWAIAVVALVVVFVMLAGLRVKLRNAKRGLRPPVLFWERVSHLGGAGICLFVGTGTAGVIIGLDSAFRLPGMLCALVFSALGRGLEWRDETKAGRRN